jgi:hypothetical protein
MIVNLSIITNRTSLLALLGRPQMKFIIITVQKPVGTSIGCKSSGFATVSPLFN